MTINNEPLVSVIIPNYNHARFLDERIQSVLNQTYQNFEVIILDDKSTDNSVEVINKYKENPHVSQVVINEENSGSPFKQWHKGFELAKGDWIWLAESDDSCELTFLERIMKYIISNDVVLAYCKSQRYDENGRRFETYHNEVWGDLWEGREFIKSFLATSNVIMNASSVVFNKQKALSIAPIYMDFKGSGDWLFWIELASMGNVYYVNETLNLFRKHGHNTTESQIEKGESFIENKRILNYMVNQKLITERIEKNIKFSTFQKCDKMQFKPLSSKDEVWRTWEFGKRVKLHMFVLQLYRRIGIRFNLI